MLFLQEDMSSNNTGREIVQIETDEDWSQSIDAIF